MNPKPKIYILGASGFLGGGALRYFKDKSYEIISDRIDVTDLKSLKNKFGAVKPEVVINFAGVKAYPNIDWCEDHKKETIAVNVIGAVNAMMAALDTGAYPIQISSGCVYNDGPDHQFAEDDKPNFFGSFYSRMRIVLQEILKELPVLTLRLRMPISGRPHPRNTINKIFSYSKVISVPNSVTLVEDFYPALEKIIQIKPIGILNLTNEGHTEHKDIIKAYKEVVNPEHKYELISVEKLDKDITKAQRSNCVLSVEKAKSLGIIMPAINESRLKEIMVSWKKNLENKTFLG